jgi:hypothetical protein
VKIKCAVVAAFVSLAFVSQALAVLRPMFPIRPAAPSNGELIVIGDELVLRSAKSVLCITDTNDNSNCRATRYYPDHWALLASVALSRTSPFARYPASK